MHSGEAEEAKKNFKKLSNSEKDYLIEFLKSFRNDTE